VFNYQRRPEFQANLIVVSLPTGFTTFHPGIVSRTETWGEAIRGYGPEIPRLKRSTCAKAFTTEGPENVEIVDYH
jgi:hypothetical protein